MLSGRPQARCRRASDNDAQSDSNRWKRDRRKAVSISFDVWSCGNVRLRG
jgi:hypothetical protein